jgi:YggT family protein
MNLGYILKSIVNFMLAVVGVLLGLRFILKLFGANAGNGFVNWIYENSAEILGPFRNVFPAANLDGFVIEFSTIFALIVYGLIGMLAFYLIDVLTPRSSRKRR